MRWTDSFGLRCVAGVGCYTTQEELSLAVSGDYLNYYELACAGGDDYACFAQHVAANDSWWGNRATNRLLDAVQDKAESDQQCANEDAILEDIRKALAKDYAAYLPASRDQARLPKARDVAQLHWDVFDRHGLPPKTFGGSPFGKNYPLFWHGLWCPQCE